MKRRRLAWLLLLSLCLPGGALAEIAAVDGDGAAIAPGGRITPGTELNFTCELPEDMGAAPALRVQLEGMTMTEISFLPGGEAGEEPETIYGSDGCILLFSGPAAAGDAIAFRARAQEEAGEARVSLLEEGETLMEAVYSVGFAPTPSPAPAPVSAPAETEEAEAAKGWIPAVVMLGLLGLGAAGYFVIWPKIREKRKDAAP